jgi:putative membrane protein
MKENLPLAKKLGIVAWVISGAVLILVGVMRRVKLDVGIDFSFLPPLHASFNVGVAIALLFALYFIKQKNIKAHRNSIFVAMVFSFLFLLSYVAYHFTTEETKFCMDGMQRTVYFILLISHIVLAAVSLPFILFTFIRGFTYQVEKHKKLARWVWPIWFYVAVSGPICYLMLRPCYS